MIGPTSQKTNGTINAILKGLEHFPLDIPPEEVAKIMNDELVSSPELNAELKRLTKTLLADRPVKSVALLHEDVLANIADPVKAAECAKDWPIALLKDLNDNPEFKVTPRVFAELKQIAEIFLPCNQQQQQLTKQKDNSSPPKKDGAAPPGMTGPVATTDPALFAKGGPPNLDIKIPEIVLQSWAKQREAAKAQDEAAKAQIEFYNAVRPSAFILGFTQIDQPRIVVPRNITSAEEFLALVKEAEDKCENLFFRVGAGGTTATKDQILECPYLWGDCDPDRTKDEEQDWQEIEKELRGRLGIRPFGVWQSGSDNWQFLIKLDQPIKPDEAETLVDKLHTALGRNPVVRNCKGVLHVPGSVYWNNGQYYLPRAWFDDNVTTKIDDVRRVLANSSSSSPKKANGAAPVSPLPSDDTGLADPACMAVLAARASKVPPQVAVPAKTHHADNPVLEQMNHDFAAGFIGSKFRVAKFDLHPRYPRQRHVEFLSKDDFINGVRHPLVEVSKFDKTGKLVGTTPEPRGAYWLGWSGRSEFDAVTFKPGAPPIIEVERDGRVHRSINTYSGLSVVPDHVDSAAKCAKYLAHVHDNIAGGDEALYKYTLDWMASGVQHPDNPARSALSLRGVPGCGKGVFALGYGRLFGQHFLHATHRDHVIGKFNAHQAETCLIFVDEALYAEIAADAQILKTMTSETTKLLERKGIDPIQIDNYARQIFATNAEHPIQIEHDDRRYPAIYVRENEAFANETDEIVKAEKRKAYFMPILDELKNGGSEALLGLLLDRDIRGFNAEAIPETAERRQQKLNSASAGDKIIIEFAQDACLPGALPKRPWIARAHGEPGLSRNLQTPGLFDVMKAHGGPKLAHKSDTDLAKILKDWDFTSKPLTNGKAWEAPPLLDLRKAILAKYPAVEFDDRSEWVADDGPVDTRMTA